MQASHEVSFLEVAKRVLDVVIFKLCYSNNV